MKIDAHQHFWEFDPAKHSWIGEEMAVLKRDFMPDELEAEFTANDIDGCVAVQADQSESETDFLITCSEQHNIIKGVVGWTDLMAPDVEKRLEAYAQQPVVKGFRHVIQDEQDPEFILNDKFQRGLKNLHKYNFTYDLLIFPHQLEAALKAVALNPDQHFVLDHIAKPDIRRQKIDGWGNMICALSKHENVTCKISGMVTEADWQFWRYEHFEPYLDCIFHSFGPDRIMYGSDWPVCLVAAEYNDVKKVAMQYISGLSKTEQAQVMGLTAMDFYNITG